MTCKSQQKQILHLIFDFVRSDIPANRFVPRFIRLWKKERDAQWAIKSNWDGPLDEELQVALVEKRIGAEEFSRRWNELWGSTERDLKYHDMIDKIFSACDDFPDGFGSDSESGGERLRAFVAEAFSSYFFAVTKREEAGSR